MDGYYFILVIYGYLFDGCLFNGYLLGILNGYGHSYMWVADVQRVGPLLKVGWYTLGGVLDCYLLNGRLCNGYSSERLLI